MEPAVWVVVSVDASSSATSCTCGKEEDARRLDGRLERDDLGRWEFLVDELMMASTGVY